LALTCGLIGLPLVGKTTLFNLLTCAGAETSNFAGRTKTNVHTAGIPDARLDFLAGLYHPRKYTPAALEVIDVPGLSRGSGAAFLAAVWDVDALIHVVRAFRSDTIPHVEESLNPARDLENVDAELILTDLQVVETRLERIAAGKKIKGETLVEQAALRRCQATLDAGQPLLEADLAGEEWQAVRSLGFLTVKPALVAVNIDEDQLHRGGYAGEAELELYASARNIPVLTICAQLETEIASLEADERSAFLGAMGIAEPGINRVAQAMYSRLGLISFLTAGEDEVRAWTIRAGTLARAAAGKVHSDIERGFIRAEVVNYDDLVRLGDMSKVKEKGLMRLDGKDYVVQDGDIINFRFNI
jgi:GTP-binding protein YchF